MNPNLPAWLPSLVEELRAVSSDLLEPGLAKPVALGARGGHGPLLRSLLSSADAFAALTPRLLAELDMTEDGVSGDRCVVRVPRQARHSTAPQDYAIQNGRAIPTRWLRFDPEARPDSSALRWALHVCTRLQNELLTHTARLEAQLQEALLTRAGESEWAIQDAQVLRGLADGVQERIVAIRQAEMDIRAKGGGRLTSSDRAPWPYPKQPAWSTLKRLARSVLRPETMLGTVLRDLLSEPIAVADVPFLYQRWCGLQLVRSFERLGWVRHGDLTGPLFLGGRIEMSGPAGASVTVWIEPRVSSETMLVTGWGCASPRQELTPDFLITCGSAGMRDAFVLDATMSKSDELLRAKSRRYRNDPGIIGVDTLLVAGVPVARRPLRAWAIAPLGGTHCQLGDPEGRSGSVPLHPGRANLQALDAWLTDVSLHAQRQMIGAPTSGA